MASHGDTGFKAASKVIPEAPVPRSISIRPPTASGESQQDRPLFSFGPPPALKKSTEATTQTRPGKQLAAGEQRWDVKDGSLECISPHFPLERNHVLICDSSPSIIADRVARCLAGISAHTTYNDEKASAIVETQGGVKFKISLFRQSADQPNKVLLECQRRRGDGYNFHKIARTVLRAGRGQELNEERCKPSFKIPASVISGEGNRSRPSDPLP
mmetsp:Transcript_11424/g.15827  ORF Transcript_11424/g.15827 Transcript_11424/m.15827 type:complete len:215 (-) Transcript_11424:244-888(-)